jgi:hypothetical protein
LAGDGGDRIREEAVDPDERGVADEGGDVVVDGHRLWTSEPVQNKLDQAGHAVKTQALPFVADKVGDAVKAAGQAVKEKASAAPVPAKLRRGSDGSVVAEVTTAPHPAGSPSESSPTA